MKVMHSTGEATKEQVEEFLRFVIEARKRVKDQILRIYPEFEGVDFGYAQLGPLAPRWRRGAGRPH